MFLQFILKFSSILKLICHNINCQCFRLKISCGYSVLMVNGAVNFPQTILISQASIIDVYGVVDFANHFFVFQCINSVNKTEIRLAWCGPTLNYDILIIIHDFNYEIYQWEYRLLRLGVITDFFLLVIMFVIYHTTTQVVFIYI